MAEIIRQKEPSRFSRVFEGFSSRFLSVFSLLEERNNFFQNLSLLIGSGTPLVEALRILSSEVRSRRMKRAIENMWASIEGGGKFWEALSRHSFIFSEYEIRMIKIAEETGELQKSLSYLANQLEKDADLRGKIRSALFYPIIVISFAGLIGMGVSWFVLPKLSRAFASLRIQLPAVTNVLITMGDIVNKYGQIIFPSLIVAAFLLALLIRLTRLKFYLFSVLEIMPGIGPFLKQVRTARLSLFMGTLLDAGVPIMEALETLEEISEAPKERRFFKKLKEQIEIGESFAISMPKIKESASLFPVVIQQMIFVAEKSGRLPNVFIYIADLYDKRVDLGAKNLTQTLEPILLVGIAGVVAFIAIAIVLPIYSLLGGLQGGAPPQRQTPPPPPVEESKSETPAAATIATTTPETPPAEAVKSEKLLRLLPTPLGYLNLRTGPGTNYRLLDRIDDEGEFEYTTIEDGWYRIILKDGRPGWIYGQYAEIIAK